LDWPRTNTLAYFAITSTKLKKSFIRQQVGIDSKDYFSSSLILQQNMLKNFFLARFSIYERLLRVRPEYTHRMFWPGTNIPTYFYDKSVKTNKHLKR
jgi:hypothetical protein